MRIISKQVSFLTYYSKGPIFCFNYKRTYYSTPVLLDKKETTPLPKKKAAESNTKSQASSEKTPASQETPESQNAGGFTLGSRIRRPKFTLWLHNEAMNFINVYDKPNYLDINIPFPMNPLFKPQPPLDDKTKEEIWLKFTQGEQTPRKIGTDYGISLKRVEAILRLKKKEKDMIKEGITLQENLRENFEKMLGARSFRGEPLSDTLPKIGKPNFEIIDENQDFSPKDAAKVLRRPSLAKIQEKERKEESFKPFSLEEKSAKGKQIMTLVGHDKEETNKRFQFKFKVVGKEQNVILRDRDGSLYKINKELIRQH